MKILIVGQSRSGTTSLMNAFYDQGYFKIGEPYNHAIWDTNEWEMPPIDVYTKKNIVVKTLIHQIPKSYQNSWNEFIIEFAKYFDKILWLNRQDIKSHWESIINLYYRINTNTNPFPRWKVEDIPQNIIDDINNSDIKKDFHSGNKLFYKIINELKQTVTWYEDLYGEDRHKSLDIIKSWNLDLDANKMNQYLHPSKKLRLSTKKTLI